MRVVIRSLDYADFLAVTLPAWVEKFPEATVIVATSQADRASHEVAQANGATAHVTAAWYGRGQGYLDGGAAADEAFGFSGTAIEPPHPGETCISADADVYPVGELPELEPGAIHGCAQYYCPDPKTLKAHLAGELPRKKLKLILPRSGGESHLLARPSRADVRAAARRCIGYCVAWHHRPELSLGTSKTAGGFDIAFRRKFLRHVPMTSFYVLHLGQRSRANWRGRVLPAWPAA